METSGNIELQVVNPQGKKLGMRNVPAEIFGADIKPHLLHQVVRWTLANKRAGTHKAKTRAEVAGGGAKPWRQKGTGRARSGTRSSPVWVGGGAAHGPKPRDYSFRLNKQARRQALCSALTARQQEGRLILLSDFELSEIKSRRAVEVLFALGVRDAKRLLVVLPASSVIEARSLRNVEGVKVLSPESLNVYDILKAEYVVLLEGALEALQSRLNA